MKTLIVGLLLLLPFQLTQAQDFNYDPDAKINTSLDGKEKWGYYLVIDTEQKVVNFMHQRVHSLKFATYHYDKQYWSNISKSFDTDKVELAGLFRKIDLSQTTLQRTEEDIKKRLAKVKTEERMANSDQLFIQTKTLEPPEEEPHPRAFFGHRVTNIGDINGDGADDLAIGARNVTVNGIEGAGKVYVFSGKNRQFLYDVTSPNPTKSPSGNFGYNIKGLNDINNDGTPDFIVGAPFDYLNEENIDSGRAYIISGANGKILHKLQSPTIKRGALFGFAVAAVGDVNADEIPDIMVGAPNEDVKNPNGNNELLEVGQSYFFSGIDGSFIHSTDIQYKNRRIGNFGHSIDSIQDLNEDGIKDYIVGAPDTWLKAEHASEENTGKAYVFSGADDTIIHDFKLQQTKNLKKDAVGSSFGDIVKSSRDINQDGHADVIVAARFKRTGPENIRAGKVFLFSGKDGQFLKSFISPYPEKDGAFGQSVASIKDVNDDNIPDFLIGAYWESPDETDSAGRAYLFSGKNGNLLQTFTPPLMTELGFFGHAVTSLNDPSKELPTLVISAFGQGSAEGKVYFFAPNSQ